MHTQIKTESRKNVQSSNMNQCFNLTKVIIVNRSKNKQVKSLFVLILFSLKNLKDILTA